jgi:aspartate aminotransferase-like enzyme
MGLLDGILGSRELQKAVRPQFKPTTYSPDPYDQHLIPERERPVFERKLNKYQSRTKSVRDILKKCGIQPCFTRESYKTLTLFDASCDEMRELFDDLSNSHLQGVRFEAGKLFDEGKFVSFRISIFGHGDDFQSDRFTYTITNDED